MYWVSHSRVFIFFKISSSLSSDVKNEPEAKGGKKPFRSGNRILMGFVRPLLANWRTGKHLLFFFFLDMRTVERLYKGSKNMVAERVSKGKTFTCRKRRLLMSHSSENKLLLWFFLQLKHKQWGRFLHLKHFRVSCLSIKGSWSKMKRSKAKAVSKVRRSPLTLAIHSKNPPGEERLRLPLLTYHLHHVTHIPVCD